MLAMSLCKDMSGWVLDCGCAWFCGSVGIHSWVGGVGCGWVSVGMLVMSFAFELGWMDGRVQGDGFVRLHGCE